MKTKLQVESQTAVESEKNYTKPRRTTNIFGVFDLKQGKEEANEKENIFGFLNCNSKVKRQKKTIARIKLDKAKRNNKNIFGILGFEKINNTSKNK